MFQDQVKKASAGRYHGRRIASDQIVSGWVMHVVTRTRGGPPLGVCLNFVRVYLDFEWTRRIRLFAIEGLSRV